MVYTHSEGGYFRYIGYVQRTSSPQDNVHYASGAGFWYIGFNVYKCIYYLSETENLLELVLMYLVPVHMQQVLIYMVKNLCFCFQTQVFINNSMWQPGWRTRKVE